MEGLKKISQEYFDSIVSENQNDFGMSESEAIEDAQNQLKSQNCDLSIICKYPKQEQTVLIESLKSLSSLIPTILKSEADQTSLDHAIQNLKLIKQKFDQDISFRCLATKTLKDPSTLQIFMSYLENLKLPNNQEESFRTNDLLIENFLNTFQSYLNQQSDVLDSDSLRVLIKLTSSDKNESESGFGSHTFVLQYLLKCINASCQMSESNRQFFVENGLCENLMKIFIKHKTNDTILCDACQLIRSLLLDDDLRVEFGHSHEHAKFIASKLNGLDVLLHIGLSNETSLNEETLANIMLTLSKLAVRNEYCQEICDKGGLKFVLNCIDEKHLKNLSLLKSALSLLKSICNNDQVRYEATKSNGILLLKDVLQKYVANPQICELACSVLPTLLLRNPEGSEQLYSLMVHQILVQILNMHSGKPKLVKNCCLALRNSISRNRSLGEKLLELKIEEILRPILNQNDPQCFDEVKSVLRDLGCHVELKELWAGTGRNLDQ